MLRLKVLVSKVDWFVPKCGMVKEALKRVYVIPIVKDNFFQIKNHNLIYQAPAKALP